MFKILSVNPGSTSTKFALYHEEKVVFSQTIRHLPQDLAPFPTLYDQYKYRVDLIRKSLKTNNINTDQLSAVVGRGGMVRPLESGVYEVNDKLVGELQTAARGEHASNIGAVMAREIASGTPGCKAFIADPVVVDELSDVARISGTPLIPRISAFHALNHKAMARRYARETNTPYEKLHLVIAHMGGGISVAAHRLGKVTDVNQGLGGNGPFSPERCGTLDAMKLTELCFSGQYSQKEIQNMLVGQGGLTAHLGSNDVEKIQEKINAGDKHAKLILEAMAYNVCKEIGAMLATLEQQADAVILTGGIAYSRFVTDYISKRISVLAKVVIYPGEDELEALAMSGLRVLRGEKSKVY